MLQNSGSSTVIFRICQTIKLQKTKLGAVIKGSDHQNVIEFSPWCFEIQDGVDALLGLASLINSHLQKKICMKLFNS